MPNLPKPGAFRRLLIPILLLSAATPALAQYPDGAVVQHLPQSDDPAELLAQALRTLATEPNNLAALTAAGHNAVLLGDPNAAVGFFGKAQEIAPNDGRVKAGLGSALVQLEKPQDALRLFAQASRLGVPDADLAEDRGLAYDLTGDQARAQADYRTVLAAHPEDDTARRRLALSQGISGQKAAAIATLDPLIRKRDIAGWRAQTFVLAMDGDAKGANDITRIMLPQQAAMLQPFLVRLATLSPADKARAVHFGEMPASSTPYTPTQVASMSAPATYAPAPRSDLAPPATTKAEQPKPTPVPTAPATTLAPRPTQVAAATPSSSRVTKRPEGVSINDRDQIFALGQPRYVRAPLAGIALTPAKTDAAATTASASPAASRPAPAATAAPAPVPTPQPVQLAQAEAAKATVAGPPMPAAADLPTPAAQGHYDLPHDAVAKAPARPARTAPAPVKTVGTPVVHGKTEVADADTKKPSKTAGADDDDTKARGKVPAKDKARIADASDDNDDCVPVPTAKSRIHGKTAARKKAATTCKAVASADDGASKTKSASSSKAKQDDADAEDCAPTTKTKSRGKAGAKKKPSTTCTKLASKDDDSGSKTKKGAKSKSGDDADDGKSSKSAKSAKSEKGNPERIYVQVAGGANKDDMDKAWAGVKKKAPELMKGHTPSTTPLRATNRLLVGPFKTEEEAQAFVNKMAAKGLSGFTFKSSKGQKVDKVDTGQ
ncbi:SPOR domain-containing protein [Sphingomonas oryzagri]|uniref:SPOR domain-containing protein n=1 Tax=Sphingomonas oryzagri TaxID=3042314 RepID=A0ABT6N2I5_9SPHN|nr:SPOR domain-containing protein [Sphingomonas oryzagri]MDH7639442.1 SPOR domain-containing protein [Sphingomonas oryzagri]